MVFYKKNDIEVSLVEEKDIKEISKIYEAYNFKFDENVFDVPTPLKFENIMREGITKTKKTDTVIVLKKNNEIIGYLSCFVRFDCIVIGHIAVKTKERNQGFGTLLINTAIKLALASNRQIKCTSYGNEHFLLNLGFKKSFDIHYTFEGQMPNENLPDIFASLEDYEQFEQKKIEQSVKDYGRFLNSNLGKIIMKI